MRIPLAALLLALAACTRAPADPTVVAANSAIEPGTWTLTTTQPSLSRPGYPTVQSPDQAQPHVRTVCVSAAEAAAFDPAQLGNGVGADECRRDAWSVRDGAINSQLLCKGHAEDIREVPTTIHGAYTRRSFWLQVDQTALGMTFSTMVKAERTGSC